MSRRAVVACFAAVLSVAVPTGTTPAQDKPAATKPSADETAVRAALKTLAKALEDGDAKGIGEVIHAANPTERKMVDAMASMATEIARLHKAAAKAFGQEAAKELTGDLAAELSRVDGAEVIFSGAAMATVRYKPDAPPPPPTTAPSKPGTSPEPVPDDDAAPPQPPLIMKKIDGKWRVPVSELSKDTTPEEIEQRLVDLDVQTKVVAELAGDIAKGKYKSAAKAAEAWQAKMMQSLTPRAKRDGEQPKTKSDDGKGK